MKQELPIAIGLLALGGFLCAWQSNPASYASAAPGNRQAQKQSEVTSVATSTQKNVPANPPQQASAGSGNELLREVAAAFTSGPSRFGDFEVESHVGESHARFKGRFWQKGSGSNESRIELVSDSSSPIKVTHVCDGRMVYRLLERREEKELHLLDLKRLNNGDASLSRETLSASFVGSASIGEMLHVLANAFNLQLINRKDGEDDFVELAGTWRLDQLSKLMFKHVDHRQIIPTPNWASLPPQFPHAVRIRLSKGSASQLMPDQIQFVKFEESSRSGHVEHLMASIHFGDVTLRPIKQRLFRLDVNQPNASDQTPTYNQRIDMLIDGSNRVAGQEVTNPVR